MDRKFGACRFVQRTLPPVTEVTERIYQPIGPQSGGVEVEDGDLLSGI